MSERDLRIHCLRSQTDSNIIMADSKKEIIALLKDERTRYLPEKDAHKGLPKARTLGIFLSASECAGKGN